MKNMINRALAAKKNYIQPEMQVVQLASILLIQDQSASTQSMSFQDIPSDQW